MNIDCANTNSSSWTDSPSDEDLDALYYGSINSVHTATAAFASTKEKRERKKSYAYRFHEERELLSWLDPHAIITQFSATDNNMRRTFYRAVEGEELKNFIENSYLSGQTAHSESALIEEIDLIFQLFLSSCKSKAPDIIRETLLEYLPSATSEQIDQAIKYHQLSVERLTHLAATRSLHFIAPRIFRELPLQEQYLANFSSIRERLKKLNPE